MEGPSIRGRGSGAGSWPRARRHDDCAPIRRRAVSHELVGWCPSNALTETPSPQGEDWYTCEELPGDVTEGICPPSTTAPGGCGRWHTSDVYSASDGPGLLRTPQPSGSGWHESDENAMDSIWPPACPDPVESGGRETSYQLGPGSGRPGLLQTPPPRGGRWYISGELPYNAMSGVGPIACSDRGGRGRWDTSDEPCLGSDSPGLLPTTPPRGGRWCISGELTDNAMDNVRPLAYPGSGAYGGWDTSEESCSGSGGPRLLSTPPPRGGRWYTSGEVDDGEMDGIGPLPSPTSDESSSGSSRRFVLHRNRGLLARPGFGACSGRNDESCLGSGEPGLLQTPPRRESRRYTSGESAYNAIEGGFPIVSPNPVESDGWNTTNDSPPSRRSVFSGIHSLSSDLGEADPDSSAEGTEPHSDSNDFQLAVRPLRMNENNVIPAEIDLEEPMNLNFDEAELEAESVEVNQHDESFEIELIDRANYRLGEAIQTYNLHESGYSTGHSIELGLDELDSSTIQNLRMIRMAADVARREVQGLDARELLDRLRQELILHEMREGREPPPPEIRIENLQNRSFQGGMEPDPNERIWSQEDFLFESPGEPQGASSPYPPFGVSGYSRWC